MDRRKFLKTSMCIGCGAAMLPASQSALLTEISSKFSKDKFVYKRKEDLPNYLKLEVCSLCQLNCPACWMRQKEENIRRKYGLGYLKFENFKNLIDDNPQIKSIELSHKGEIFLNPELGKIIEYACKKNVELTAGNGVNLNDLSDEMAEILVKYKFKHLTVSIDGATPETYKIYRVGGDYNKVIDNIKKIQKYKKIYNSEYPELVWKFIVFGHNEHEIELAKERAKYLDIKISFMHNSVPEYSPVRNKNLVYLQTGLNYSNDECVERINNNDWFFCYQLFESPQIDYNGNLLGCCSVTDDDYGVNIFEVGLMNALNSKQFIDAKHMVTDLSYKNKTKNPCVSCWYYKNLLKKENFYVKKYA